MRRKQLIPVLDDQKDGIKKNAEPHSSSFGVKTPAGTLVAERKASDEFPGIYIYLQNESNEKNLVACIEFDTEDNSIKIESYQENEDTPVQIVRFEDGEGIF